MTPKSKPTPVAMLNVVGLVVGLVVAAAGIMIQYVSGVDYPTIPPGPVILLAAAAVVAFGPWSWAVKRSSPPAGVAGRPRGAQ